jgi:hypothetical protein
MRLVSDLMMRMTLIMKVTLAALECGVGAFPLFGV